MHTIGRSWCGRERNVEIEFPSDRRTRPAPSSSFSSSSSGDGTTRTKTIKIVKIPCCSSESYQELSISVDADKIGDQLTELLRIYFNRGITSDLNSTEIISLTLSLTLSHPL